MLLINLSPEPRLWSSPVSCLAMLSPPITLTQPGHSWPLSPGKYGHRILSHGKPVQNGEPEQMTTVSVDPLYRIYVLDTRPFLQTMFLISCWAFATVFVQSWYSTAQPWPPLICTGGAAKKQLQVQGAGKTDLGSLLPCSVLDHRQ